VSDQITNDLMVKVADDVTRCVNRTLAIAPEPLLPIGISAIAATLGITALLLQRVAGAVDNGPEPDCVMLAALLGARLAIDPESGTKAAYADLECLKSAGRISQP
jgi:hypothetical protein